jgi:3-isopropylmalate dehydrogenase
MQLINRPTQFDVIVTSKCRRHFVDEASMHSGSIGMLASASLAQGRFGLYEPIHGSAPDIADKGISNPLATILSAAMMLKYSLELPEAAVAVEAAVSEAMQTNAHPDIWTEGLEKVGTCDGRCRGGTDSLKKTTQIIAGARSKFLQRAPAIFGR